MDEKLERSLSTRLQAEGEAQAGGKFEVVAITAGEGNGWIWPEEVLRESLSLWEGVECFVDHAWNARSVRDLAGVFEGATWDDERRGVRLFLHPSGPSAALLTALGKELTTEPPPRAGAESTENTEKTEAGAGKNGKKRGKPRVGFSADVVFLANKNVVKKILRVNSLDLVFNPARGGAFLRALNSVGSFSTDYTNAMKGLGDMGENENERGSSGGINELEAMRQLLAAQQEKEKLAAEAEAARQVRAQMCGYLLESGLAASKLPAPMQEQLRKQFGGKVFDATELDQAIKDARELVSQLTAAQSIHGPGRIEGMFDSKDRLVAAVDDLFGVERDENLKNVKAERLQGIRELYLMLTGDYDLRGGYDPARAQLATTADFTGLVKNALNKIVINTWDTMGQAGYSWWQRVVTVEHFNTLNQVTGTLVGTVGDLPAVAEGAEYTELAVGDSPEVGTFTKYGGYVPLTLELIDRDETRKLKAYARELGVAGLRKVSSLVAGIFTQNSGVGPTMADGGALFNATAVTTAGGHANLLTTALSSGQWETVKTAVYNQPALIRNAAGYYGTGPKLAINPRYLLVPRALELTAKQILYPTLERASQIYSQNMQQQDLGDVVTVPEWTDANDWAAVCDPRILPAIYVGERFGIRPEVFVAGDELSPAVFMNDETRLKVRHFLAVWVNDFRPLHKSNV